MKHLRYLRTFLKHRWYVFVECVKMGIVWRGIVHDLSKLLPSEWFTYVEYFEGMHAAKYCGPSGPPRHIQESMDLSRLKHLHRNKHHWQHWVLREENGGTVSIFMPMAYVKEMLADWRAGARVRGKSSIKEWFEVIHHKIELHPASWAILRGLMKPSELPPTD